MEQGYKVQEEWAAYDVPRHSITQFKSKITMNTAYAQTWTKY